MKNWMNRFAVLAVLGSIVCSAVLVGCGGGEDDAAPANNAAKKDDADPDMKP